METDELCYLDLSTAANLLQRREVSPVELVEAVLERIERINPLLNAFITVAAEEAREAARQSEGEIRAGSYRGPLHGVPLSLKDVFATRGMRTSYGSRILAEWVPERDATVAARLREAGAILIGKNNMHEFALGSTTTNPHFGAAANPCPGTWSGYRGAPAAAPQPRWPLVLVSLRWAARAAAPSAVLLPSAAWSVSNRRMGGSVAVGCLPGPGRSTTPAR
jgi:aspartyl-tRNA(Asn)/glutamyl-tRNA(Gln) amidotransferase subunit A